MPRIGELLVAEGVLSEVAVQSALGFQRHTGEPFRLGTILLDRDLLGEENLLKALSVIHRCDYVSWSDILKTPPHVVRLLSERAAVRLSAIPYSMEGRGLRVAFKNPSNLAAVDEVSAVTNRPVIPAVITEVRLLQAFHLFYGRTIPMEFRSVLQKLERNEERRLYRTRATMKAPMSAPRPTAQRRERAREIPIAFGAAPTEPVRPSRYAAPFASAELASSELADSSDFLPDFAPPHPVTPEEQAAMMWKDDVAPTTEADDADVGSMWAQPVPEVAPVPAPLLVASPAGRPSSRDQVAEATLDSLAERFPRLLLLLSAHDAVLGWTARGAGLTRERISGVKIPWGEPSIFAFVKLSGSPHRGALSRILVPPALAEILGPRAAPACAVFPVRIKDRLIAFLYADRLGAPLSEEDYRTLEVASSSLGSSLARLLLELRRGGSTH
jgi:hypothetical protein